MNLNTNQIIAIVIVILGVLVASTAQLTDIFGAGPTKIIVSAASMFNSILAGILGVLTGQSSQLKAVNDMPGVEKIVVNKSANTTLANMAVDPSTKIEPAPGAEAVIQAKAQQ